MFFYFSLNYYMRKVPLEDTLCKFYPQIIFALQLRFFCDNVKSSMKKGGEMKPQSSEEGLLKLKEDSYFCELRHSASSSLRV